MRSASRELCVHLLDPAGGRVQHRPVGRAAPSGTRRAHVRGRAEVPRAAERRRPVGRPAHGERLVLPRVLVPVHLVRLDGLRAARGGRQPDHHAAGRRAHRSPSTLATGPSATDRVSRAFDRRASPRATCRSLETSYTDADGVRYRQESFVGRAYGKKYGVRSVISFVRLEVDTSRASQGATVCLAPSRLLTTLAPDRLSLAARPG